MGKIILGILGVVLCVGLSACGHKNPLKTATPDDAAKFLYSASQSAEKQLKIKPADGRYYGGCLEGKNDALMCKKLYKGMVDYAKTQTLFKGLNVSDVTDKGLYRSLKDDYAAQCFNSIDMD